MKSCGFPTGLPAFGRAGSVDAVPGGLLEGRAGLPQASNGVAVAAVGLARGSGRCCGAA